MSIKTGLPLDGDAFTTFIASVLAQEPEIKVLEQDTLALKLTVSGITSQVNLANAYDQYRRAPEILDKLARAYVSQTKSAIQAVQIPELGKTANSLYPLIKPRGYLDTVRAQGLELIWRPFLAGLALVYVIDRPDSMIPLTSRHTAAWQVDEPTLYQMTVSNLAQRKFKYAASPSPQPFFFCQSMDGYDATRIVLTGLMEKWAAHFYPHRLILGIPNRDFLIGFSDADPQAVRQIAQQVRRDAASRAYALTDRLLTWANGELSEYRP